MSSVTCYQVGLVIVFDASLVFMPCSIMMDASAVAAVRADEEGAVGGRVVLLAWCAVRSDAASEVGHRAQR